MKKYLKESYKNTVNSGIFTYTECRFYGRKDLTRKAIKWLNKKHISYDSSYDNEQGFLNISMRWNP